MPKGRVLHICSFFGSGFYQLLIDELKKRDYEQYVYYFAPHGTQFNGDRNDVLFEACYSQVDRLFFKHKENIVIKRLLESDWEIGSFDLLHAHSLFSNGYVAMQLSKKYKTPYFVAVRNTDVNAFFKSRPYLRHLGLEILSRAKAIVFLSTSYRDDVLSRYVPYGMREELERKSRIIPNGISKTFLDCCPTIIQDRNDDVIRLVQVGQIDKNKNQRAVVEACKILERNGYPNKFTVIGRPVNKKLVEYLKASNNTTVLDPMSQEELIEYYRASDVFVMPSKHETFGLVYAEAMSQGLPVIYSRGQGFDGQYPDGYIGHSIDCNNPSEIAYAAIDLFERRKELFDVCICESTKYDWERISEQYDTMYSQAMGVS